MTRQAIGEEGNGVKSEVFNCDCVEFMRGLPDNTFDLAIADPPYGGGNSGEEGDWARFNGSGRQAKYKNSPPNTTASAVASTATRRRGGQSRHYVFGLRKKDRAYQNRRNLGGEVRQKIVEWDTAPDEEFFKELCRVSRNQIVWGANYFPNMPPTRCFVVWKKLSISENFSMAMAEYAWTSFSSNAKLFEAMPQDMTGKRFHPTQKPVSLYSWLLRLFAMPGDKIFDPMMGSQSSRIAAYNMGFDYTGCERDPEYFAKGCARFDEECRGIFADAAGVHEQLSLF